MVHIVNTEYWVGWVKNIALVIYCVPEVHFTVRLLLCLSRNIQAAPGPWSRGHHYQVQLPCSRCSMIF